MSQRQGVIKRDFMFPLHQAIMIALRGSSIAGNSTWETVLKTSLIKSLKLDQNQNSGTVPILDFSGVEKMTEYPYITVGDNSITTNDDTKGGSGEQILVVIHIWSRYNGRYEADYIANQVLNLLTGTKIDMSANGFSCYGFRKEFDRTTKEGEVTHRVLRFRAFVEDLTTVQPL